MKLKSLMATACAAIALGGFAAANNYYVDANNGNDLWDGSTPEIPSAEVQAGGGDSRPEEDAREGHDGLQASLR